MNILDIIYPPICGFCEEVHKNYLCKDCQLILKKYEIATINKVNNKKFDYVINMLKYEQLVREKLIKLKFNEQSYLNKTFAEIVLKNEKICSFLLNYDIIESVPMYRLKKLKRGYNQTELIAKEISSRLNIKFEKQNLVKVRNTESQSKLNQKDRYNNIKNAFKVNNRIDGKKIILFDDIYTTGSTVNECSKVLKKAGAKEIVVLTLAKD